MAGFSSRLREKFESTRSNTAADNVSSNNQSKNIRGLTRLGVGAAAPPSAGLLRGRNGNAGGTSGTSIPLPKQNGGQSASSSHRASGTLATAAVGLDGSALGGSKIVPGWGAGRSDDTSNLPSGHLAGIQPKDQPAPKALKPQRGGGPELQSQQAPPAGKRAPWAMHQPSSPPKTHSQPSMSRRRWGDEEDDNSDEEFPKDGVKLPAKTITSEEDNTYNRYRGVENGGGRYETGVDPRGAYNVSNSWREKEGSYNLTKTNEDRFWRRGGGRNFEGDRVNNQDDFRRNSLRDWEDFGSRRRLGSHQNDGEYSARSSSHGRPHREGESNLRGASDYGFHREGGGNFRSAGDYGNRWDSAGFESGPNRGGDYSNRWGTSRHGSYDRSYCNDDIKDSRWGFAQNRQSRLSSRRNFGGNAPDSQLDDFDAGRRNSMNMQQSRSGSQSFDRNSDRYEHGSTTPRIRAPDDAELSTVSQDGIGSSARALIRSEPKSERDPKCTISEGVPEAQPSKPSTSKDVNRHIPQQHLVSDESTPTVLLRSNETGVMDEASGQRVLDEPAKASLKADKPSEAPVMADKSSGVTHFADKSSEATHLVDTFTEATHTGDSSVEAPLKADSSAEATNMTDSSIEATKMVDDSVEATNMAGSSVGAMTIAENIAEAIEGPSSTATQFDQRHTDHSCLSQPPPAWSSKSTTLVPLVPSPRPPTLSEVISEQATDSREAGAKQSFHSLSTHNIQPVQYVSPAQCLNKTEQERKDLAMEQQQNVLRQVAERRAAAAPRKDRSPRKKHNGHEWERGRKLPIEVEDEKETSDHGRQEVCVLDREDQTGESKEKSLGELTAKKTESQKPQKEEHTSNQKSDNSSAKSLKIRETKSKPKPSRLNPCRIEGHDHDWNDCPSNPKSDSFVRNNPCRIEGHEHDWNDCPDNPKSDNYVVSNGVKGRRESKSRPGPAKGAETSSNSKRSSNNGRSQKKRASDKSRTNEDDKLEKNVVKAKGDRKTKDIVSTAELSKDPIEPCDENAKSTHEKPFVPAPPPAVSAWMSGPPPAMVQPLLSMVSSLETSQLAKSKTLPSFDSESNQLPNLHRQAKVCDKPAQVSQHAHEKKSPYLPAHKDAPEPILPPPGALFSANNALFGESLGSTAVYDSWKPPPVVMQSAHVDSWNPNPFALTTETSPSPLAWLGSVWSGCAVSLVASIKSN